MKILLSQRKIQKRVKELSSQISRDYSKAKEDIVILANLKGSFRFVSDLVKYITIHPKIEFIMYRSYIGPEPGNVKRVIEVPSLVEDSHVLIVEDIVDTGYTIYHILHDCMQFGPIDVKVVALLNKPSRREIEVPIHYLGFTIPNVFVFGYGLDYDEKYRELNNICVKR